MSAEEARACLAWALARSRAWSRRRWRAGFAHPERGRLALLLTPSLFAGALLMAAPWVGWWAPLPFLAVAASLASPRGRAQTSAAGHALFAAWIALGIAIATGVFTAGRSPADTLIAIAPVAAVLAGVTVARSGATPMDERDVERLIDRETGLLARDSLDRHVIEIEARSELIREPTGVALLRLTEPQPPTPADALTKGEADGLRVDAARRLHRRLGAHSLIFRVAGDELLVLVHGDLERTLDVGREARDALTSDHGSSARVAVSCGVSASWPGETFDFSRVRASAALALRRAESAGGIASEETGTVESYGALAL